LAASFFFSILEFSSYKTKEYKLTDLLFVIILILVFFLGLIIRDPSFIKGERAFYTLGNPNLAGHFLLLNLAILGFLLNKKKFFIKLMLYLINLFLLILTFSKSSLIGAFFYFLILSFSSLWQGKRKLFYFHLIFSFILGISLFFTIEEIKESYILRKNLWVNSLDIFFKEFILGIGLGNFSLAYLKKLGFQETWWLHAHNIIMQLLIEVGLIGTILFFLPYLFIFKKIFSIHLKAGILSYFFASLFDYTLWFPQVGVTLFLISSFSSPSIRLENKVAKVIIILLIFIFWISCTLLPFLGWCNFSAGVKAVNKRDFASAIFSFATALKYQPTHPLWKAYYKAAKITLIKKANFEEILGIQLKSILPSSYFSQKSYIYISSLIWRVSVPTHYKTKENFKNLSKILLKYFTAF
jgi:hypothetical protein